MVKCLNLKEIKRVQCMFKFLNSFFHVSTVLIIHVYMKAAELYLMEKFKIFIFITKIHVIIMWFIQQIL